MTRTKLLLLLCFLVAFSAGGAVGLVVKKTSDSPAPRRPARVDELKLTPEQQAQWNKIWNEARDTSMRLHRNASDERDKAIAALMTPQQKAKYEQILQDYDRKTAEPSAERKLAFDQAVEKTKLILTPEQNKQYDEMLKRPRERGPGSAFPRRGGPRSRPTTEEANAPHVGE